MNYKFDTTSLEIINRMIHDASVDVEDLLKLKVQDKIKFNVERRTFEDVERKKFLFWNKTVFKEKLSQISISGVIDIVSKRGDKGTAKNVFVNELNYNSTSETLKLVTIPDVIFEIKVSKNFVVELSDIRESQSGRSGLTIGKFGYTKQEWNEYLREKNYHA
jgi:hypothetical protein